MTNTERTANQVPSLQVKSNAGTGADVLLWADPSTHRLLVDASVTLSSISGSLTNNDAAPAADNIGALVAVANAAAPSYGEGKQVLLSTDLAGALRVTGSLSVGGTTDNSAFTAGSSTGTPAMGFYHATVDTVTDGRSAVAAITSKRALHVTLHTAAGVETGVAAAPLQVSLANTGANATAVKVDGSAVTQPVSAASLPLPTGASTAAKQPALGTAGTASTDVITVQGIAAMTPILATLSGTNNIATVTTVTTVGAVTSITNALPAGTNAIGKLAANSGVDIGDVDVTTVGTITPGTAASSLGKAEDAAHSSGDVGVFALGVANEAQTALAADGDYIAQATDTKGNRLVIGNVAHDAADAGAPVKIGGKAVSAEPTAVAANDRANLITDLVGKLIVMPYANPENFVSGVTAAMTGTTSTSLVAAPAAGLRNYITHIIGTNSHATVGTFIIIQDGSGGTTIYEGYAAAVGGGFSISFPVPLRQPTTATALYCANVTTGANTIVAASGYKGA